MNRLVRRAIRIVAAHAVGLGLVAACGCGGGGGRSLVVDLRTDYVAAVEVAAVEVELLGSDARNSQGCSSREIHGGFVERG